MLDALLTMKVINFETSAHCVQYMRVDGRGPQEKDDHICVQSFRGGLVNSAICTIVWHEAVPHVDHFILAQSILQDKPITKSIIFSLPQSFQGRAALLQNDMGMSTRHLSVYPE